LVRKPCRSRVDVVVGIIGLVLGPVAVDLVVLRKQHQITEVRPELMRDLVCGENVVPPGLVPRTNFSDDCLPPPNFSSLSLIDPVAFNDARELMLTAFSQKEKCRN
jgi:hypothetical protein